jgi:four helix bundle protein
MQDFKNLEVWNKAHNLTLVLYKATSRFPKEELFGLTSQIRRCSASIGANIAEGTGRTGHAELHRFLQIARGSTTELEYHCILSRDLGLLTSEQYLECSGRVMEIRKMLTSLIKRVSEQRQRA